MSAAKQIGVLAFERNGDVEFVTTEEFGSVLYNSRIQLALLLACETARVGNDIIFNCLAPNLILAGVPAVIGMQFPVLDSFANLFANSFYEVLLDSGDLLKAIRMARRMNVRGAWYCPSLYLRHKPAEVDDKSVFETRHIDTAVPSEVIVGTHFLVRLWIRCPSTAPRTDEELRKTLGISEHVEIATDMFETDVKFEKAAGRKFRRGELLVRLQSDECEIKPAEILLFVDEIRDAPPAIFVVKANKVGRRPLIFSVWQDGNMIASIIHQVDMVINYTRPKLGVATNSSRIAAMDTVRERIVPTRYGIEAQKPAELFVHTLNRKEHLLFLNERRSDPLTNERITEGDRIVVCSGCESVHLLYSWNDNERKCPVCESENTLNYIPQDNYELQFEKRHGHKATATRKKRQEKGTSKYYRKPTSVVPATKDRRFYSLMFRTSLSI